MSVPSRIKTYIPIIYMIFLMLPLYAILMTSFKTEFEIKKPNHSIADARNHGELRNDF